MPIRVTLSVVVLAAGIAAANAATEIGHAGHVKEVDALACPTTDIVWKYLSLGQDDPRRALLYAVSKGCSLIDKGTEVFVEDVSATGLACVRPKGKVNCVWVSKTQVTTD
ncbi:MULTISPECIES: hypothetical protein [unclassified Bradyrhizobium]|uniref:hypothetical protein n=1 Tax=unclassified Bradyrhizobium TaxID=2631580 RepID=UPI0028E646EF|nr:MULTISPECIES: hypothetical protein [unclassified Bradyrhizobium]